MKLERLTSANTTPIHRIRLGRTSCYLVQGREGALLVDSGLPPHAPTILRALAELGLAPSDLRAILLTHRHLDHAGGAALLQARSTARVVIHEADARAARGEERLSPLRGPLDLLLGPVVGLLDRRVFKFRPPAIEPVSDGFTLGGLRLVHLPGHTPGHSGYVHEETGVVFAGDAAVVKEGAPFLPSRFFSLDPPSVRRSLSTLAGLDAPLYCFGHGHPLERGGAALGRLGAT